MLTTPTKFRLVAGRAEGGSKLNAFDGALLDSGFGNVNLVKVSSILPPGAIQDEGLVVPPGSLTPTAYAAITSETPGQVISAAVAVGLSKESYGVIMECSGVCSDEEARERVTSMVEEAFGMRGVRLSGMLVRVVRHEVVSVGCAFAAVILWY